MNFKLTKGSNAKFGYQLYFQLDDIFLLVSVHYFIKSLTQLSTLLSDVITLRKNVQYGKFKLCKTTSSSGIHYNSQVNCPQISAVIGAYVELSVTLKLQMSLFVPVILLCHHFIPDSITSLPPSYISLCCCLSDCH